MARLLAHFVVALAASLSLAVALAARVSPVHAAGKALVVIMATSTGVKDIGTATLRRAFQGFPTEYTGGKRFIPINHPTGTPPRVQFDRAVLGLAPEQVGAFWIDRRIRDESPPPRSVPSAELALRVAASLPGAITYVVPEMVNAAVRVLTIDGKAAGHAEYLLR